MEMRVERLYKIVDRMSLLSHRDYEDYNGEGVV